MARSFSLILPLRGSAFTIRNSFDELVDWIVLQGPELINLRLDRALRRSPPGKVITESDLFSEWDLFGASDVVEPYSSRSNRDQISASCGCVALRKCVPNGALICTNYNLAKLVARAA